MKSTIKSILGTVGIMTLYIKFKEGLFPNNQIKLEKKLLRSRQTFYSSFIPKDAIVFDIGANWGNRSEVFLSIGAKVIALEPLNHCYQYLKYKFMFEKCTVINKGVGSSNRIQPLYKPESADTIASFSTDFIEKTETRFGDKKWKVVSEMEIVTLDSLIEKYGSPSFIKIDVEGYELDVLQGLSQKTNIICFEFTLPELHEQLVECLNSLSNLGLYSCNYAIGETTNFNLEKWISKDHLLAEIETFKEKNITWGDVYIKFEK